MQRAQVEALMTLALVAARRGRGHTHPNPMVGAVVARGGEVVAVGHHARVGGHHAEVVALMAAGARARGADMVVTLEPCCHQGRTGPCTEALVAAGIRRVWVAMKDPFAQVNGRGLRRLAAAGIEVHLGVGANAARRLNEAWLLAQALGRPFVTAKTAQSLDGRVACHTGRARWITSAPARAIGHRLRAAHDAVVVGRGTVAADDPLLTCRLPASGRGRGRPSAGGRRAAATGAGTRLASARSAGEAPGAGAERNPPRQPLRVVVDSCLALTPTARLFTGADVRAAPVWVACGAEASLKRRRRLEDVGATVLPCPGPGRQVDLAAMLSALYDASALSVLVEGGPTLLGSFFDAHLVDRIYTFIAPRVLGGAGAPAAVAGVGAASPEAGWRLSSPEMFAAGEDLGLTGRVERAAAVLS